MGAVVSALYHFSYIIRMYMNQKNIRNFAIVAHIDHGKSTLADRLLEDTGTVEHRLMTEQILDSNPIEKERGITIKLAPVRMEYTFNNEKYILNLIDTPGHVDFSYEVSRSLSACEGILLVVDASQGVQAQTLAHMQLIKRKKLKVIPIINKIDLPTAKIEDVKKAIVDIFGFDKSEILEISAKEGIGIEKVFLAIIERIPHPTGFSQNPLRALVFSSQYDTHKGVICYIRIIEGTISTETLHSSHLTFCASLVNFDPIEIGFFNPKMQKSDHLSAGDVGYVATGLKDLSVARVGDTITYEDSKVRPLPEYKVPNPMVFLCIFPIDNDEYLFLRESLEKLHLSDSSFTIKPYSSPALGKGFLCGFLGLLHAEIIQERLYKEFKMNVIATAPTVEYKIYTTKDSVLYIHSASEFPDPSQIRETLEPMMYVTIYTPADTVGNIMQLCQDYRAEFVNLEYIESQAKFEYIIPLSEMVIHFFDELNSKTAGYASMDYEFYEYRIVDAVKLDIYLNHKPVDAFSQIVTKSRVQSKADRIVNRLRNLIPRHQFQIPIQAAYGSKIIARSDIKSFRKDVTRKLYGGDRTRKDKLLEAQKKGKKRLKEFGSVSIPQEVFLKIYKDR